MTPQALQERHADPEQKRANAAGQPGGREQRQTGSLQAVAALVVLAAVLLSTAWLLIDMLSRVAS